MKKVLIAMASFIILLFASSAIAVASDGVPAQAIEIRNSVFRIFCQEDQENYSVGSCFVIDSTENGTFFVTNHHVIENAMENTISVVKHDGTAIPLTIVADEPNVDLCVLKTQEVFPDSKPIVLAKQEDIDVGQAVYALGFPGAADNLSDEAAYRSQDVSITNGIISAIKQITLSEKQIPLIQMNAAINHGSSGGPLVDAAGRLIGINTLLVPDANGLFGAVSTECLKELLDQNNISYSMDTQNERVETAANAGQVKGEWIIIGLILLAVVVIFWVVLLLIRSKRKLTLTGLMNRRLHGYSYEQVVDMLAPIVNSLKTLHTCGLSHGQISPQRIFMDGKGSLSLSSPKGNPRFYATPYTSLEQYESKQSAGTFSDVYAIGALMYYMIVGKEPINVMQRLQKDSVEADIDGLDSLSDETKRIIKRALAIQKTERIHDVFELGECISFPQVIKNQPMHGTRQQFVNSKKGKILGFAIGSILLLTISAAATFFVTESNYQKAQDFAAKGEYESAGQALEGTLLIYKDTKLFYTYICAGLGLNNRQYDQVKEIYISLGNYRDSAKLAIECDYRKAKELLNNHTNYEQARAIFVELSKIQYKDSSEMVKEVDYQQAKLLYKKFLKSDGSINNIEDIKKAISLLDGLKEYKDSPAVLMNIKKDIYTIAIKRFNEAAQWLIDNESAITSSKYSATQLFDLVPQYEQTEKYMNIIHALEKADIKRTYLALERYWDFQPAKELMLGDTFIGNFLLGKWSGEGYYINFTDTIMGIQSLSTLPAYHGKYYKIDGQVYYVCDDDVKWQETYRFDIVSKSKMYVTSLKNNRTYLMRRQ